MAQAAELKAKTRNRAGKGASRAIRREGRVPAVIYGDKKDPETISLGYVELNKSVQAGQFMSTVFMIDVEGSGKVRVLPRDVQFEPVRDTIMHVDFLRISKDAKIVVEIPVSFFNEDDSPGLKRGGALNVVRHTIEVSCPADAIPSTFEVDVGELDINEAIHASEIKMPENVELTITDRDFTVVTITSQMAQEVEKEEEDIEFGAAAEDGDKEEGADKE